jgi:GPH family glycoside/pentoside/hexuronide:cation symporter
LVAKKHGFDKLFGFIAAALLRQFLLVNFLFNSICLMEQRTLSLHEQVIYAFGMMGWSIMINLIGVVLIYLYVPPNNSGFPIIIIQATILVVFNLFSLITASGRLTDAVFDPLIAQLSDRSKNKKGRRIPFMRIAILPSLVFCFLVFYPLKQTTSGMNAVWLTCTLMGFYISTTTYIIPYSALLPELAHNSKQKVRLSTFQSVGYVLGIAIASNIFCLTDKVQAHLHLASRLAALQYIIAAFALLAALLMAITAWGVDEKKYSAGKINAVPLKKALKQALSNKNFRFFIIADFSYFIAITLITSGMLYFIKVLLQLPESMGNLLMATMVGGSFVFYPIVNILSLKIGKKIIVIFSLLLLAVIFAGIVFLGKFPINPYVQIYGLVALASIPVASLNILPVAILAEVIAKDSAESGSNKEGIYFAVRYFFVKIAQTLGLTLFAMFLLHGKDVGHDFGIRLNGVLGFVLCIVAATIFTNFKEEKHKNTTLKVSKE